jgi:uncharacterized membrane protein
MNILAESIEYLWYSVYGIVAGLGISMMVSIAIVAFIIIRLFRAENKIKQLENRLVHAERDYNISLERWTKKH